MIRAQCQEIVFEGYGKRGVPSLVRLRGEIKLFLILEAENHHAVHLAGVGGAWVLKRYPG
jgi:hypothetical protein